MYKLSWPCAAACVAMSIAVAAGKMIEYCMTGSFVRGYRVRLVVVQLGQLLVDVIMSSRQCCPL